MNRARYVASFLIVMLSIGVNVGQRLLEQFNIDRNYLLIALIAIVIAGLIAHRNLFFIVIVAGLTVAINLPAEEVISRGIDPDILFTTLLAVIVAPAGLRLLGVNISR
jgi:fucose permease